MAKMLIFIGLICIAAGVIYHVADHTGISRFLGNLPGDIRITRGNTTFYFPVATSVVISIVASLVATVFLRR